MAIYIGYYFAQIAPWVKKTKRGMPHLLLSPPPPLLSNPWSTPARLLSVLLAGSKTLTSLVILDVIRTGLLIGKCEWRKPWDVQRQRAVVRVFYGGRGICPPLEHFVPPPPWVFRISRKFFFVYSSTSRFLFPNITYTLYNVICMHRTLCPPSRTAISISPPLAKKKKPW